MITHDNTHEQTLNRRDILALGLSGLAAVCVPLIGMGSAQAAGQRAWRIALKHAHTGERFSGVYRVGDHYMPEAFARLNLVLRDHRTGEAFPMDPRVLDIASLVQARFGHRDLQVLSAYRSPKTNASLRKASSGVARNSFHMYGQALDIRMPGVSTRRIRDVAKSLKAGGVGYYARSDFIHVDTGAVRSWS